VLGAVLLWEAVALLCVHMQLTMLLMWEHPRHCWMGYLCGTGKRHASTGHLPCRWLSASIGMCCQSDTSMCFWVMHAMQCWVLCMPGCLLHAWMSESTQANSICIR
jgi:hypothetical protein